MKKILISLCLVLSFHFSFAQDSLKLNNIKHIELVSTMTDSMALISKDDIDIINKVFHERNVLDSICIVNDTIISVLKNINIQKDSIILNQRVIIDNDSLVKENFQNIVNNNNIIITELKQEVEAEKATKRFWQIATGIATTMAFLLIIL